MCAHVCVCACAHAHASHWFGQVIPRQFTTLLPRLVLREGEISKPDNAALRGGGWADGAGCVVVSKVCIEIRAKNLGLYRLGSTLGTNTGCGLRTIPVLTCAVEATLGL